MEISNETNTECFFVCVTRECRWVWTASGVVELFLRYTVLQAFLTDKSSVSYSFDKSSPAAAVIAAVRPTKRILNGKTMDNVQRTIDHDNR